MIELKPCPFCNGKAKFRKDYHIGHGEKYTVYYIQCGRCEAKGKSFDDWEGTPKEEAISKAVKAWNERG